MDTNPEEDTTGGTNASGLSQEMVDLDLVEAFPPPVSDNLILGAAVIESGEGDDQNQEMRNGEGAEQNDDCNEFEDGDQLEQFMIPLDYSPIKYDGDSDKSNLDDDWSDGDVFPEKRSRNRTGVASPKISVLMGPFDYDGDIHPLMIPNVVRDILKHVGNVGDLQNFRVLNKLWNAEACGLLQSRNVVTFLDQQSISTYLTLFQPSDRVYPHSTYQIYNNIFDDSNLVLNQFLTAFGSRITTLILQQVEVPYEKLYNVLRHQVTNLRSLWLRCIPIQPPVDSSEDNGKTSIPKPSGSPRTFPLMNYLTIGTRDFMHASSTEEGAVRIRESFVKLVHLFPNLRRITMSELDHVMNSTHCMNVLQAVVAVGPNHLKYLNALDFPLEVDEQLLSELTSLKCQYLNELDLTLTTAVSTQTVTDFVRTVGPNMNKLSLAFPRSYPYDGFHKVRLLGQDLKNVRDLTLERFRWDLGFLEQMPHLEKLIFKDTEVDSIFPNTTVEMKLKVLRIEVEENSSLPAIPAPSLKRITRTFPYLKSLHISGLTDACLRIIYFDLPCLNKLELVNGEFTDYGVTGVDLEVCKDLAETTTYLVVDADKLRTDLFIGNLTNLKNLQLESNEISDLSILFGICKCSKLESLKLKSSHITDLAVEALADQLGHSLKSLNILNCPEVSEAGIFYFRESVPSPDALLRVEPNPEAERAAERARSSRRHASCDSFIRRRNDLEAYNAKILEFRKAQALARAQGQVQAEMDDDEWPLQLHPMNLQMVENEEEEVMDALDDW